MDNHNITINAVTAEQFDAMLGSTSPAQRHHIKIRDLSLGCEDRSYTNEPVLHLITSFQNQQGANRNMTYVPGLSLPLKPHDGVYDLRGTGLEVYWLNNVPEMLIKVKPRDDRPHHYLVHVDTRVAKIPSGMTVRIKCLEGVV